MAGMRTPRFAAILLMTVGFATVSVYADTKIEYKATEGGGSSLSTILIGQGKVRSEAEGNLSVIMDPTAQVTTILDHGKKTFTKIGKAEIAQIVGMLKQMEDALASAPPEMRQMIAGRMGGTGSAVVTTDTGEKSTVAGKSCRIFKTSVAGRLTTEQCMGDASAIDVSAADRATMAAAMAWSKELTDALAKSPMGRVAESSPFRENMVPLRSTTFASDGSRKTSEFSGVSSAAIPADMFAIPAGYKEQKLDMGGRGRGGM